MHSQRLREKPLIPWVITLPNGEIKSAHCTCMAGLAESCTHIAAIFFWIDIKVRMLKSKTVTDEKSYWLVPTNMTHLEPQELSKLISAPPKVKKVRIDNAINETSEPYSSNSSVNNKVKFPSKPPSDKELEYFYEQLNSCEKKSCILRVVPKYCEQFKPQVTDSKFSPLFSSFYIEENETLIYDQIILKSEDTFSNIRITETQVSNVENEAKGQYTNNKWFRFRAGRISPSVAKDVCSTKIEKPSISLVKKICYCQDFRTIATSWGIKNEKMP